MKEIDYWDIKQNGLQPAMISELELGEFIYYIVDLKRGIKLHKTRKPMEAIYLLEMMQYKYGKNTQWTKEMKKNITNIISEFKTFGELKKDFKEKKDILNKIDKMKKSELVQLIKNKQLKIKYSNFKKKELIEKIKKEIII